MSSEATGSRVNLAHTMIVIYVGLAAVAVAIFFPGRSAAAQQVIAFSARYTSLLLSALPLVVAAGLWTAGATLLWRSVFARNEDPSAGPPKAERHPSVTRQILNAIAVPLSMEPRLSLKRVVTPVTVAASGALHPITILSAILAFGGNSGFFLFFLVYTVLIIFAGGAIARIPAQSESAVSSGRLPSVAERSERAADSGMLSTGVDVVSGDLYHRLRFTLLGLLVAVAIHILIPDSAIRLFTQIPVFAVVALALLAALLSVPPEVAPYAAALFFGRVPHGAVLAFLLISAFGGARGLAAMSRAQGYRSAGLFAATAFLLTVLLTAPIRDLAAGALW